MSHLVTIQTQIKDPVAVAAACTRLGLPEPVQGTAKLYSASATGLIVRLPGWNYPVVCDTAKGETRFDNYGGAWGEQKELDRFLQAYAVEKAKIEARRNGRSVVEQSLPDGGIRLTVQLAG